jgi:aminoglycoside phosphotransferase (APT) family kinase protein
VPAPTEELAGRLAEVMAGALSAPVEVGGMERLPGGASRQTWGFWTRAADGTRADWVLRMARPGSSGLGKEPALLAAARAQGVPVPSVVAAEEEPSRLGPAFMVLSRVPGETIPRRILRDDLYARARPVMAGQCGQILARIHRIPPQAVAGLAGEADPLGSLVGVLDSLAQPRPALELAIRWLDARRPPSSGQTVVHGDFRNGNLVVGEEGVRAVLDWELAHLGDPLEDLGWLCVKSWRFGEAAPVGGFGGYEQLLGAYEAEAGARVDREALRWWEVFGNLRWGVICIVQCMTHLSGAARSVELATIGRRVCEAEWDLLELIGS